MTMFRVGPAGIPASLKTDMNAVLNKKFGTTGQNYPPAGWPDDVNLLGPLPVKTASGAVASFSDGADDVQIKSIVCNIEDNLSGAPGIVVTKTGKNALPKFVVGTYTDNGITATVGEDNICRITGKNTSGGNALVVVPLEKEVIVSNPLYCHIRNTNATILSGLSIRLKSHWPSLSSVNRIFSVTNSQEGLANIAIQVAGSQSSELDFTINPSFEYSNVETGYEQYKEVEVIEVGFPNNNNLFDKTKTDTDNGFVENKYLTYGGAGQTSQNYNVSEYIEIEGGENYLLNNCAGTSPSIVFYTSGKSIISGVAYDNRTRITVQAPQNAKYCRISIPKANVDILSLRNYTPIYGGNADVISGTGQKTWEKKLGSELTWELHNSGNYFYCTEISSEKASGQTNVIAEDLTTTSTSSMPSTDYSISGRNQDGAIFVRLTGNETKEQFETWIANKVIVFEKASEEDFSFEPVSVDSYYGYNNLWSDTGDTECEYYADIDLALQALSGSRGLMMSSLRSAEPMIGEESDPEEINELEEPEITEQEGDNDAR